MENNNLPWWGYILSFLSPIAGWMAWGLLKNIEGQQEKAKQAAYTAWIGFAVALIVNIMLP